MREEEFLDSLVQYGTLNNKQKQSSSFSTEAYTQCGTPKLFSGALLRDAWPACRTWTSANGYQRLKDLVPNNETMVEVMQSSPSSTTDSTISIFKGSGSSLQTIHMTFKDFIESSDVGLYLAQAPIVVFTNATAHKGILYGLSEDVKIPSMMPPGCDMVSVNAWCSGPGSVLSSLHYDCHENLLCVVDGEKIVRLAPFDVVPTSCLFYEHPYEWGYGNHTDSYTLFPEYTGGAAKQRAIDGECVETHHLNAGDVLYIPKGYWHQVLSGNDETHTIAINFWWDTPSETNLLFARLLKENAHIGAHAWDRHLRTCCTCFNTGGFTSNTSPSFDDFEELFRPLLQGFLVFPFNPGRNSASIIPPTAILIVSIIYTKTTTYRTWLLLRFLVNRSHVICF